MAEWKEYTLGELLQYEQPTAYIVKSTDYNDNYKTPVLTAGKTFILGYTNERQGVYDELPVIIFDDFTTASQYVNFKFKVKSSAMKILKANTGLVLPKFVFYRMQIIKFDASTHKRYWIQHYSKIKVKIPPTISEQEHIISRIEELFSQLDVSVNELKTAKERLKVYRQAVLKEAFEGTLTGSEKIGMAPLGNYVEKPRYGTSKKCGYTQTEKSVEVYRIPNIDYATGQISHQDIKYSEFSDDELAQITLKCGDILIVRSNGSVSLVGRAALIREIDIKGTFAGYLMRLRLKDKSSLVPAFLLYFLQSHEARIYIENKAKSTSGVHNINSTEISGLMVPIFRVDAQQCIVSALESRLSVCNSIEKTVDTALQQVEALRQSILKIAFEGRL